MVAPTTETGNLGASKVFTPKDLFFKYVRYLPWLLLSVCIMLIGSYILLRYTTPIYNVSGKLLVKDQNFYGNDAEKFAGIFMMEDESGNLADEIQIISSRNMGARVARSLAMNIQYKMKGNVRTTLAHPGDMPFLLVINRIQDSSISYSFLIKVVNNSQFKIGENSEVYNFNQFISLNGFSFKLTPQWSDVTAGTTNEYIISWQPETVTASMLSSRLNVVRSEGANVLNLTLPTENVKIGLDIVNTYMREYQLSSLEDKKQIAFNTLDFIDHQLDTLHKELGQVEKSLQNFREKNLVINPEQQSELYFGQLSSTTQQITEQEVNLKIIDFLLGYLSDDNNRDKLVPSNLGISEPSLVEQIARINQLQLERETLLRTTPAGNHLVKNLEVAITKLKADIIQNLQNFRQTYVLMLEELKRKSRQTDASIRSIPSKEKQFVEVSRQQNILQELYSFLLQKKLETSISSASTISNIKVLEPAMGSNSPVSPRRRAWYSVAILLGLAVPAGLIFAREYFNDKVRTKQDITRATSAPILGEVGHAEETGALVVAENNRSFISEQFRIIRSNLQYVLPKGEKPIILITSSFSGEGKSFISTNIGAVLALSGKKTAILEFDIRKPKILKGLGLTERKGITNYIIGNIPMSDIVYPVPSIDNLYVVPCGPVPPNPAELLLDEKIQNLFSELTASFDAVIIDTAPVGMVSDALSLAAHANASIYIVRHNYTNRKQIELVDNLYTGKKLPALSVVINDIDTKMGYGSYYGYGYGYGFGKTHDSYFQEKTNKRKRLSGLFKSFKK